MRKRLAGDGKGQAVRGSAMRMTPPRYETGVIEATQCRLSA